MRSRKWSALGVVVALAAVIVPGSRAEANHAATLTVNVGAPLNEEQSWESMRFFPEDLTVHKGDTITFKGGFHTATLLPKSVTDPDAWIAANVAAPGAPYSSLQPNPDNEQYPFKLLGDNVSMHSDCGTVENPCSFVGDTVVDSGLLFAYWQFSAEGPPVDNGFSVTVDGAVGDVFWIICRLHPKMRMRVVVAGPNEDSTTQEQIDGYTSATVAEDQRTASGLHENLVDLRSRKRVGGKSVWKAYSGYDTDNISLFEMYPRRLTVRKGDKVQWRFGQLNFEIHTVTFSNKKAQGFADRSFPMMCDPNGDDTAGSETPSQGFPPTTATCDGAVGEFQVSARTMSVVGDGKVTSIRDLENSGIRGAYAPQESYTLKFPKRADGFKYLCAVHDFMRGTIRVK